MGAKRGLSQLAANASRRRDRKWFEPTREPKRPKTGFIGLQNHDPGDIVYFKEVSVRAQDGAP